MYYNSYDAYCDQFGSNGPEKLQFTTEVLARVTETIRELLLNGGDDGFEEDDLAGAIQDWERDDNDVERAYVSIELRDDGRDDGKTGWYSREFTFDESGQVTSIVRIF